MVRENTRLVSYTDKDTESGYRNYCIGTSKEIHRMLSEDDEAIIIQAVLYPWTKKDAAKLKRMSNYDIGKTLQSSVLRHPLSDQEN